MAKKRVNRKKILKKQWAELKKAGKAAMGSAVDKAQETAQTVKKAATQAAGTVTEKAQDVFDAAKEKIESIKTGAGSFEEFTKELEAVARLETFYAAGIQSAKDFANWTEKELLELKGIGPATMKQLKELGISFKD